MIIGTAGHIDHGKTALVGALTGVDTDRLKEEKARGISIDLGFAYLPTPFGATIGFVDVPGHERFVHNMLAGAAGIDFVVLVVAADDGPMPQTIEHLAIVDILGIERGIVVLTKIDLVDSDRLSAVKSEIASALAGSVLSGAKIVEASSATGEGVDALREKLFDAARCFGERKAGGRFRMAVDRSFTLDGIGTVVAGTVRSGEIAIGDHVAIGPSGREARVRGIHAQNRAVEQGRVGDRCALNLAGDDISRDAVARGDVVLDPFLHAPADRIDAMLRVLPSELKPVRQWTPVRLHHGAIELGARIALLGDAPVLPGEEAPVQLVLEKPIAAAAGDRFVIRDTSARRTIGGGFFLDLRAPGRRRKTPQRLNQLRAHAIDDPKAALLALLRCEPFYVNLESFSRDRSLTEEEIQSILASVDIVRLTAPRLSFVLSEDRWSRLKGDLCATLEDFHGDRPNEPGIDIEKLRFQLEPRLPTPLFVTFLRGLAGEGYIAVEAAKVRLTGHSVSFPPRDEAIWRKIEPLIDGDRRFAPPRVRDLEKQIPASEAEVRRVLKLAARMGKVIEVAPDEFLVRPAIAEIVGIACDLAAIDPDGSFSVARFRDRLAVGRNVSVRILEFLDRQGLTMRRGDVRKINSYRIDHFAATAGAKELNSGGEAFPVERPDFKSGRGRQPVFGGFDSHSLPPDS